MATGASDNSAQADFVEFIRQLLQGRSRRAKRVHLVLDNLNIHFAKIFVDVLGQKRSQSLTAKTIPIMP